MKKLLILLLGIVLLYACHTKEEDQSVAVSMQEVQLEKVEEVKFSPPSIADDAELKQMEIREKPAAAPVAKKIIKDGELSVKTKDIASAKKVLDAALKSYHAYYESETLDNNEYNTTYTLKIRVPSNQFESLLIAIEKGEGEVTAKSIQSYDVTEEYVDIEGRLKNKREYLKRYKDLLGRANTIKDILALEENIRVLQEEIESKEGRLKYLNDQVAYSTLNMTLFYNKEYVFKPAEEQKFSEQVKSALSKGWHSLVGFILWLIKVWPWIILIALLSFFFKQYLNKRKAEKATTL
ncbi:MAG: hypothetical protein JWM14_1463 [Chitinophagaceae bacterium]|nr:hypothetical protein [Chitinophagaceae bacterium]